MSSGQTIDLLVTQNSTGLLLQTDARLSGKRTEELSLKTWRMLRIGENLAPFMEMARHTPELASVVEQGGQLLRGTTFFEDVVKAVILAHRRPEEYLQSVPWIVDQFGDPLPSNPTLHAFPTCGQLPTGEGLQSMLGSPTAQSLGRIVEVFRARSEELTDFVESQPELGLLETTLKERLALDNEAIALVMLYLGRYDYIPVDLRAQQRVGRYLNVNAAAAPEDVLALFAHWQPWGGLAYWLWDWSSPAVSYQTLRNEVPYGELEGQHRTN
ncbi:MAG: hypothetical protein JXA21_26510 [Anaerolineae bacterium]|nr:hypothetical protein [Anaerolineae bacterium]